MPIRQLPPALVNKIAAGEVIERPASVVKELVENAVDAGASRIDVAVQQGGMELIRVVDNGCGIPANELAMAVAPHATSKLAEEEDLFQVSTLGFRGEALASIASVSRLTVRSRPDAGPAGAEIEVVGGAAGQVVPCGCPVGTSVEVRNLFFNTPVRRKFLRTTQTELGHVSEALMRLALALPQVHFTLRHNDRPVLDLPVTGGWLERIARCCGRELAENLIWVESSDGPVELSGYVAHPTQSRANNRMQYFFLNGRHIRDRALQHALGEAYRGLLTVGRYPIALLSLRMPPELVDVNVHPTKLEVRFQDSGRLYSQLLSTLRTRFLSTDLTTRIETAPEADPSGAIDEARAAEMRQQLVQWAKGEMASWGERAAGSEDQPDRPGPSSLRPSGPRPALEWTRLNRSWAPARGSEEEGSVEGETDAGEEPAPPREPPSPQGAQGAPVGHRVPAVQIHNRYLVAESQDGVMVIDQHALHERILFEHLKARLEAGTIETQRLLVPEPVDLSPAEAAAALENRELLARLGVHVEPFGGETVLVSGYPAMLANLNPGDVLHGLLEALMTPGKSPDRRDLLDDLLHTIACKAAIKAGDRLAPEEIDALLEQRHLVDDPHHCPHGRPTALVFTRQELDRQFKRT